MKNLSYFHFQGSVHVLKTDGPNNSIFTPTKKQKNFAAGDMEMAEMESTDTHRNRTKFKGINPDVEYTFRVCTLINGKAISRKIGTLKPESIN